MCDEPIATPRLGDLVRGLILGALQAVRENKLPAVLAAIASCAVLYFSWTSEYDERPRYRREVLPDIARAERQYQQALQHVDTAVNESWRLNNFVYAHRKSRDVLRSVRAGRARTRRGMEAHQALIDYYRGLNEEFAIVRTEMSLKPDLDFVKEWRHRTARLAPLRDRWNAWVFGDLPPR